MWGPRIVQIRCINARQLRAGTLSSLIVAGPTVRYGRCGVAGSEFHQAGQCSGPEPADSSQSSNSSKPTASTSITRSGRNNRLSRSSFG